MDTLKVVGNIDEGGFLYSLTKQGFNNHKCILELVANSIDAMAKNIRFIKDNSKIYMIDDGSGMDIEKLSNMFSMQKANHIADKSCGISGLGGKAMSSSNKMVSSN